MKLKRKQLTVHGHAHRDALLKTAQLALVARDLVNDAATFIFTGVGWMEVLLDGAAEETLKRRKKSGERKKHLNGERQKED